MSGTERDPEFLITGVVGHIGTRLAAELQKRKIAFRGVDITGQPPGGGFPFLSHDLRRPAWSGVLAEFLEPVTHVVHLASWISNATDVATELPGHFEANVLATLNLLEHMSPGTRHIAFASTMTIYGVPERLPVSEEAQLAPRNLYALCKGMTEQYLGLFRRQRGVATSILRLSSVYGPGRVTGRSIPQMIAKVLDGERPVVYGVGAAVRDYVYIDDVVDAIVAACTRRADGVFNVGSGRGTSVAELAQAILRACEVGLEPVFDRGKAEGYSLYYDISKARAALGYAPRVSLAAGLAAQVAWQRRLGGGAGVPARAAI